MGRRTTVTPGLAILYCLLPVSHPVHTSLHSSVSHPGHTSPLTLQIAPLTTVTMQPHYQAHIYTSHTPGYIFVSRSLTPPPLPMRASVQKHKQTTQYLPTNFIMLASFSYCKYCTVVCVTFIVVYL